MKQPPNIGSEQGRRYDEFYDENSEAISKFIARYLAFVLGGLACWGIWAAWSV